MWLIYNSDQSRSLLPSRLILYMDLSKVFIYDVFQAWHNEP
jgi:hypothetical protein